MLIRASLVTIFLLACGCGGDDSQLPPFDSPYEDVPATRTIDGDGLSAPVDVVRDEYGVPHIFAANLDDLAFANGYIMAHDRLPQMKLFKHAATGRVAELFGALEPDQIDADIEIRLHQLQPLAEQAWAELNASTDPKDQQIVRYFTRYADGVNAYAAELAAGKYELDPAVEVFFPVENFEPWTPVDSLTIGRLQTYALSYDDFDMRVTRTLQRAQTVFAAGAADPELQRRALAPYDFMQMQPSRTVAPLDGFPNVDVDSGTRAKPSPAAEAARPWIEPSVLDAALASAKPDRIAGLDLTGPMLASNNWIVGPSLAGDGTTILSNDTHLPLISPSIWWLVHLTVPGEIDVEGVSFPGLPMVQLGHNEHLAWGATVVFHDVFDFYAEEVAPCASGGGDCVAFQGGEVPIETWTEELAVGANGTIIETRQVTFERVPHHGPIIPTIVDHQIAPRTGNQAITVRYTGHMVTHESRAVFGLLSAKTTAEGIEALGHWHVGAMNFVLADDQGSVAYTATAKIPTRSAGCFTFDRVTNRGGVAPFMVVPGDGSCEWTGFLDARYMPHAIDPPYLATANSDPVGATFDNDPLNGPVVDGVPLYIGAFYDPGYRIGRLYDRLDGYAAAGSTIGFEEMASLQADGYSNLGSRLTPFIAAALADAKSGDSADAKAYYDALAPSRQQRLDAAVATLGAWSFDTPAAVEGSPSAAELADSTATVIFNAWAVYYLDGAYGDELAMVGENMEQNFIARMGVTLLERPGDLLSGIDAQTGEPVLCDDLATAGTVESCTLIILRSLDQALDFAEDEFGTADQSQWRWGRLHRLTLESQLPSTDLNVPPPDEADPLLAGGYPRHGDTYAVDSCDSGYTDFDFGYGHGPAMRHITIFAPGKRPVTFFALPGGTIMDRGSPHWRDQMDNYWSVNQYYELPWAAALVVEKAEERWRFMPAASPGQ